MHTISGKVGKRIVKFECSSCGVAIESPLEEAGQTFPCPSCGKDFITPGIEELEAQHQADRDQEQAKAKAQSDAEQRKSEQEKAKFQKRVEKNKAAAEKRSRPPSVLKSAAMVSVITACVVTVLFDLFIIRPMQNHLHAAEEKLAELSTDQDHLREAVNGNTETANRNARVTTANLQKVEGNIAKVSEDLAALAETVKSTEKKGSSRESQ